MSEPSMPNHYPPGALVAPDPPSNALLDELTQAGVSFDVSTSARAEHARDWWPRLIPDVAIGHVENWPGVVVRAHSTSDVSATLRVAQEQRVAVTAQGGRSGVGGGAVPTPGSIALDLTGLRDVIALDATSSTVRVQAGVFGPDLERFVRALGYSAGHLPQSFDLATVGGWIASRGTGQYSNRYGKIEDMVRALTVVLAGGEVVVVGGHGPRQAVGPDLLQLFIGSEGTLGIITEATLLVHALAPSEQRGSFSFATFREGMEACRRILQRDAHLDGSCLCFTFAGQPHGDLTTFYRHTWDVAMSEVLMAGGAISHHHGVGRNRARFVSDALGGAFSILEGVKALLDPDNILNPGVLGLGGPTW